MIGDPARGGRILDGVGEPHAALARAVVLAVVVEPALLRRARRELVPGAGIGLESDFWFGPLVLTRNSQGLVLNPDVVAALRQQIAGDRAFVTRSSSLIAEMHRDHSALLRWEEEVAKVVALDPGSATEAVAPLLAAAVRTVVAGNSAGVAAWAAQAWQRLPAEARATDTAALLSVMASLRLGVAVGNAAPGRHSLPLRIGGIAPPGTFTYRRVGVELRQDELHFVSPEGSGWIGVPQTEPPVVEVSWRRGTASFVEVVDATEGRALLLGADWSELFLRTLDGRRHGLRRRVPPTVPSPQEPLTTTIDQVELRPLAEPDLRPMLDGESFELADVRDSAWRLRSRRMTLRSAASPPVARWPRLSRMLRSAQEQRAMRIDHLVDRLYELQSLLGSVEPTSAVAVFTQRYWKVMMLVAPEARPGGLLEPIGAELFRNYVDALDRWYRSLDTPEVWTALFQRDVRSPASERTAVAVGVQALVNFALPLSLVRVWARAGRPRYEIPLDHTMITAALSRTAPTPPRRLAAQRAQIEVFVGPLDPWTRGLLHTAMQADDWTQAWRLWRLRDTPVRWRQAVHSLDRVAALLAEWTAGESVSGVGERGRR